MTAAFWSRFKRFLLSRTYGCRGSLEGCDGPSGGCRSLLLDQVTGARRVDLDAGTHRRGDDDRAQVTALRRGRLGADQLLDDRLVVLEQVLVRERGLADGHVDDRRPVGAVLDLAGLGLLDGLADVHRHRADLRVRHLALRAEDAAEAADHGHHVGRRDGDVEVGEALVLHTLGEVLGAHEVGAGLLRLARLVALGEDGDLHVLAEAVRQRDRPAQLLVRMADVETGADVDLDRLVELRALALLDEADGLVRRVLALAVDLRPRLDVAAPVPGHYATTSTPIERAVPSMILAACSTSCAFRSGSFFSAISRTCAREIRPTLLRFGSPEPFSSPIACLISTAAGGVFV